jgi:hypothetical protein
MQRLGHFAGDRNDAGGGFATDPMEKIVGARHAGESEGSRGLPLFVKVYGI